MVRVPAGWRSEWSTQDTGVYRPCASELGHTSVDGLIAADGARSVLARAGGSTAAVFADHPVVAFPDARINHGAVLAAATHRTFWIGHDLVKLGQRRVVSQFEPPR